jgi:aminoglycoside phosphotransferase (APT) family kinase protein
MSLGTPKPEIEVDEALVRSLLRDQHPDLADQPLALFETGWDNFTFRLGRDLALRLPRREAAAQLILNEQRWLPHLAVHLPIPIPAPLRVGHPSAQYPWPWSVLPWLPGHAADQEAPGSDQARPFASFLRALHQPAPEDAPENPFRGCALAKRAPSIEERLIRLRAKTDLIGPEVEAAWHAALSAPKSTERLWLHGDLHARNTLVDRGKISGIIDFGDITSGDPATDLAAAWALFDTSEARLRVLDEVAADSATRCRARGWAVSFGAMLLDTGLIDHPRHAAMGERTLRRIAEDDF